MTEDTKLPEGTHKVVGGAARTNEIEEELIMADTKTRKTTKKTTVAKTEVKKVSSQIVDTVKTKTDDLSAKAADGARDLLGQGLERTSSALDNISRLVGDTAQSLDEQLGEEVGDYARRASTNLKEASDKVAQKSADELIDDTRNFVRKSPGVALAGAAVIGFALARLVKSGLDRDDD